MRESARRAERPVGLGRLRRAPTRGHRRGTAALSGARLSSLRVKLVALTVGVQLLMLGLLTADHVRTNEQQLRAQAELRVQAFKPLLNAALAEPLAQRNLLTLHEVIDELHREEGMTYLLLFDYRGERLAAAGWPAGLPLPEYHPQRTDAVGGPFDTVMPIQVAGQTYGWLRFGVDDGFLTAARGEVMQRSVLIGGSVLMLSTLLLALLGYWLTRHLARLSEASHRLAQGELDLQLPEAGRDEVGQLTRAFNAMSTALRARIEELNRSEAKFHAIADYTYDWESWFDPRGRLLWVNPSVERMTGYAPAECHAMERFPLDIIDAEDRAGAEAAFFDAMRGHPGSGFEFRVRRKDGEVFWAAANWQPIYGTDGAYQGIRAGIRDITDRKRGEGELRRAVEDLRHAERLQRTYLAQVQDERARLVALLSAMNIGILFLSVDNRIIHHNPAFQRIWLIPDDLDLIGRPAYDVLAHSENVIARPDHFSKHILNVLSTHEVSESFELVMADGRVVTQVSYPVRDEEGRLIGRLWIYEDVTRERQTAEQLIYLAERDSLTGLYNRHRFQEELARMIAKADRHGAQGALLFFDLDEFKYVNDTFGHRAGDAMLIRVAGEVNTMLRRDEIFARLGGDEFAVLLPDAPEAAAAALAERITRAIAQIPFRYEGQNLRLTSSLGIALYPQHAATLEELVAHADAAMYQAKEAGKNAWRVYRPDLDASREMLNRLSWNERIAHALEAGLLRLHYQGIYDAQSGALRHVEALVRMVDMGASERLVMPGHFIAMAERTGKILDIDRWVIRETIATLARSPALPGIAVNISGRSFDDPTLPQYITEALREAGVAPQRLLVELTETSAVSDLHDAQRFIEALHQAGCRTCLDDFGTGFSSFAYLKHLRADILKIDGLFIRDLPNDRDNQVFVRAIVEVARGMRKHTVAEFVEDEPSLRMLREFGVDMVQGYHLDMPRADHPALGTAITE
ncbi:EAL domain-containing protein [Ectothiorhodospiraceae bacterium 2226]|nr:EAL domain-containing protein [Ectothiorhodospiraceae bacterium 2226]